MKLKAALVVAVTALGVSLGSSGAARAEANPGNNGKAFDAPGQENAVENCSEVINNQYEGGISAGGGPKEEVYAPTNCDKIFNH